MELAISCGGVIYRLKNNTTQILVILDQNNKWTFPKGLVEGKEKLLTTAKREIEEETGIAKLTTIAKLSPITYLFTHNKTLIQKTVHYFLFQCDYGVKLTPQLEEGIQQIKFIDIDKLEQTLDYKKTNLPIIENVKQILKKYEKNNY